MLPCEPFQRTDRHCWTVWQISLISGLMDGSWSPTSGLCSVSREVTRPVASGQFRWTLGREQSQQENHILISL